MKFTAKSIIIVIIAMVCLVGLIIWGISFYRYTSQDAVLRYIKDFRQNVAIACVDPTDPEKSFYHQAEAAFPAASTFNVVLLTAYAQEVAAGRINPQEEIPFSALDAYYLPSTDAGAHPAFLQSLGEGRTTLTLSEVADGMMIYSSNAAADYLLSRLKDVSFPALYQRLGLTQTSQPLSYLSLYLFMANHETGQYAQEELSPQELQAEESRLEALYLTNPEWKNAEVKFANSETIRPNFIVQQQATSTVGMKSSARDFAQLMLAAYGYNNVLTEKEQTIMRQHLEWPKKLNPENEKALQVLATKSGSWAGVLTSSWYAETKTGEKTILAVLYQRVPEDFWNTWVVSFSQQELETAVLTNGNCAAYTNALK